MEIKTLIQDFAEQLEKAIHGHAAERARATVMGALGMAPKKGPGRPPKAKPLGLSPIAKKPRKKMPVQLCPVPYCRNPAAPVFGMVCSRHKDVAKSKIKAYRAARKAKKAKAAT
jgi:hypothetical protein